MFRLPSLNLLLCLLYSSSLFNSSSATVITCSRIVPTREQCDRISKMDFGGVGDCRTVNTKAFRETLDRIQHLKRRGGTVLYVPPGVYMTGSFNLTSHMTLYLARGAVIRGQSHAVPAKSTASHLSPNEMDRTRSADLRMR